MEQVLKYAFLVVAIYGGGHYFYIYYVIVEPLLEEIGVSKRLNPLYGNIKGTDHFANLSMYYRMLEERGHSERASSVRNQVHRAWLALFIGAVGFMALHYT